MKELKIFIIMKTKKEYWKDLNNLHSNKRIWWWYRKILKKILINKFDKTIEFYNNPDNLRTNNKIEGYFNITLPITMKRKFWTREGLIRWIRLQKVRWTERNVLTQKTWKLKQTFKKSILHHDNFGQGLNIVSFFYHLSFFVYNTVLIYDWLFE